MTIRTLPSLILGITGLLFQLSNMAQAQEDHYPADANEAFQEIQLFAFTPDQVSGLYDYLMGLGFKNELATFDPGFSMAEDGDLLRYTMLAGVMARFTNEIEFPIREQLRIHITEKEKLNFGQQLLKMTVIADGARDAGVLLDFFGKWQPKIQKLPATKQRQMYRFVADLLVAAEKRSRTFLGKQGDYQRTPVTDQGRQFKTFMAQWNAQTRAPLVNRFLTAKEFKYLGVSREDFRNWAQDLIRALPPSDAEVLTEVFLKIAEIDQKEKIFQDWPRPRPSVPQELFKSVFRDGVTVDNFELAIRLVGDPRNHCYYWPSITDRFSKGLDKTLKANKLYMKKRDGDFARRFLEDRCRGCDEVALTVLLGSRFYGRYHRDTFTELYDKSTNAQPDRFTNCWQRILKYACLLKGPRKGQDGLVERVHKSQELQEYISAYLAAQTACQPMRAYVATTTFRNDIWRKPEHLAICIDTILADLELPQGGCRLEYKLPARLSRLKGTEFFEPLVDRFFQLVVAQRSPGHFRNPSTFKNVELADLAINCKNPEVAKKIFAVISTKLATQTFINQAIRKGEFALATHALKQLLSQESTPDSRGSYDSDVEERLNDFLATLDSSRERVLAEATIVSAADLSKIAKDKIPSNDLLTRIAKSYHKMESTEGLSKSEKLHCMVFFGKHRIALDTIAPQLDALVKDTSWDELLNDDTASHLYKAKVAYLRQQFASGNADAFKQILSPADYSALDEAQKGDFQIFLANVLKSEFDYTTQHIGHKQHDPYYIVLRSLDDHGADYLFDIIWELRLLGRLVALDTVAVEQDFATLKNMGAKAKRIKLTQLMYRFPRRTSPKYSSLESRLQPLKLLWRQLQHDVINSGTCHLHQGVTEGCIHCKSGNQGVNTLKLAFSSEEILEVGPIINNIFSFNGEGWRQLGRKYMQVSRFQDAVTSFKNSITDAKEEMVQARHNRMVDLAHAYHKLGQTKEAEQTLQKVETKFLLGDTSTTYRRLRESLKNHPR